MGVTAIKWATGLRVGSPTRKLVLLVIAEHTKDGEWQMWAGQETIAAEAEVSTRTVGRVMAELEELGVLSREQRRRRDGYRTSDLVRLNPDWEPSSSDSQSPDPESGDNESPDSGDNLTRQPVQPHPTQCQGIEEPEVEPAEEPAERASHATVVPLRAPDASRLDAVALCDEFADSIAARGSKRPTVTKAWVTEMERLIRLDGRSPDDVRRVIRWLAAGRDDVAAWWQPNIRSPKKLRAQWDHMREQHHSRRNGSRPHQTERAWAATQAIQQAIANGDLADDFNPLDALTGAHR